MHPHHRHTASVSLTLFVAVLAGADVYDLRLVAQTGDPAPGSFGGAFIDFSPVAVNGSGQVAFRATTTGALAETGYWMTRFNNPQLIDLIVGQGYPVPDSGGQHFGEYWGSMPVLNDAGNVAFGAPVGPGVQSAGIFRKVDGVVETLAIPGDAAPGAGAGAAFGPLSSLVAFNEQDVVVTRATLTGAGVNASNDRALYMTWIGGMTMVAREGGGAPGLPGRTFGDFEFTFPLISDNSQIAFDVPLNGAGGPIDSKWRGWPGALLPLVKEGDATPLGNTFTFGIPDFWNMSPSAGGAAFRADIASMAGAVPALWHSSGGANPQLVAIAVKGHAGPLGTYEQLPLVAPETVLDGTTAFIARFTGGGVNATNDTAIVRRALGGPSTVLLREGETAYGFGAGAVIEDMYDSEIPAQIALTNSGWTLISAAVRGPGINDTNNIGLWSIDPEGEMHFIARTGLMISLAGEPSRQIALLSPRFGVGQHSGRRSGINERGDVALRIVFTNGDEAVVVAQRPGPCAADLNGDGVVDGLDLGMLLGGWGVFGPIGTGGDVDWDGDTDGTDLGVLLGAWGPC